MRAAQFILFLTMFASNTAFADWQLNLPMGVTPVSHDIFGLHMTILWICVVIGLGVFGVMLYSILYHRKSRGYKAAKFHEHLSVELTWTFIPLIILIIIAIPATKVLINMNDQSQPDITIKITGRQWKWEYEYLDQGIRFFSNSTTPYAQIHNQEPKDSNYLRSVDHPLVVPIHKKIRFLITSGDVIHAWFVPELGLQRDTIPGFITESWTRINRPGTYYGQCNKLCGINHAYMPVVVVAMSESDFEKWVIQQKGGTVASPAPASVTPPPAKPTASTPSTTTAATAKPATTTPPSETNVSMADLMQKGEKVYLNTCAVCHQPNGEGMPPTFPALKGGKIVTGPAGAHIDQVLNGKPGTAMQAFKDQLNDEDLAAVITYERNSWGNKSDMVTPAQCKEARTKPPTG